MSLDVTLTLNTFGTGQSSLASMHIQPVVWPVDVIKIDPSDVCQLTSSTHHRVLVEATVRVARDRPKCFTR